MFETEIKQYLEKHGFETFTPKAVLFDMDGVIYDSMPYHARSWHESMTTFGLNMAPEEAYTYEGMRGVETIKLIARRQWGRELSDEEAGKMYQVKSERFKTFPPVTCMSFPREFCTIQGVRISEIPSGSGHISIFHCCLLRFP